jgi:hypothetical protein
MSTYDSLSKGSDFHRAAKAGNSLTLMPMDDTLEALQQFQPIAHEAFNHAHDGDYKIQNYHRSSIFPGRLYDTLVLVLEEKSE